MVRPRRGTLRRLHKILEKFTAVDRATYGEQRKEDDPTPRDKPKKRQQTESRVDFNSLQDSVLEIKGAPVCLLHTTQPPANERHNRLPKPRHDPGKAHHPTNARLSHLALAYIARQAGR